MLLAATILHYLSRQHTSTTVCKKTQQLETGFGDILLQILHFARTMYLSTCLLFCQPNVPRFICETEYTFLVYLSSPIARAARSILILFWILLGSSRESASIKWVSSRQQPRNILASACAIMMSGRSIDAKKAQNLRSVIAFDDLDSYRITWLISINNEESYRRRLQKEKLRSLSIRPVRSNRGCDARFRCIHRICRIESHDRNSPTRLGETKRLEIRRTGQVPSRSTASPVTS